MELKNSLITLILAICVIGCKYDDDYLNPVTETKAYFASEQSYTRTVIVGEGMQFKIGAAMSGRIENKQNETVEMVIVKDADFGDSGKELFPDNLYNSSELSGTIKAIIPPGDFLGYFTVQMDSASFLNDPKSLQGVYALPVKIVATSLDYVHEELDSVLVSVTYMCGVDGYYLYESTIKRELNGTMLEDKTTTDKSENEGDNSAWRLQTIAPFTVRATSAVSASLSGLSFDITVNGSEVTLEKINGMPDVISNGENKYDRKTRDFELNYKYQSASTDTVYHVSQKLMFRNRLVDGVNQTREYLSHFN